MTEPVLKLPLRAKGARIDPEDDSLVIVDADNRELKHWQAAEIVKRCNAFEPLREALKQTLELAKCFTPSDSRYAGDVALGGHTAVCLLATYSGAVALDALEVQ